METASSPEMLLHICTKLHGVTSQYKHVLIEYCYVYSVTYKFGIIAMVSGLVGVPLGSLLAQRLRPQYPRIDPMICAIGLLVSSPLLFAASLLASVNSTVCYTLIFFGEVFLNLNWSIVADMLLVSISLILSLSVYSPYGIRRHLR
jgi:uncharacterized membrane protein YfcA